MAYSTDGEGLHRHVDPADGQTYLYAMSFLDAGPALVRLLRPARPQGALPLRRRGAGGLDGARQRAQRAPEPGPLADRAARSRCPPTSSPWSPGPYASVAAEHDGIRLGLARPGVAALTELEAEAADLIAVTAQSLRLLPPALRHPVPVRGVPPGLRARLQRRRDGEPGLRHLPGPV